MIDENVTILLEILKKYLAINLYRRKAIRDECNLIITIQKRTSLPLKQIVENRIFELEESLIEPFREKSVKHSKERIKFNQHLLRLVGNS